jgi:hypothetical protein
MTIPDAPSNDVLLELGRLTWAAINLEDVVYTVCDCVKPSFDPPGAQPIGSAIARARKDLRDTGDAALRLRADSWLAAAGEALEARNTVLHSMPVPFGVRLGPGTGDVPPNGLMHFRRGHDEATATMLTVDDLGRIRRKLELAFGGGRSLARELWHPEPGQPL